MSLLTLPEKMLQESYDQYQHERLPAADDHPWSFTRWAAISFAIAVSAVAAVVVPALMAA